MDCSHIYVFIYFNFKLGGKLFLIFFSSRLKQFLLHNGPLYPRGSAVTAGPDSCHRALSMYA